MVLSAQQRSWVLITEYKSVLEAAAWPREACREELIDFFQNWGFSASEIIPEQTHLPVFSLLSIAFRAGFL